MSTVNERIPWELRRETAQFGMWAFLASEALFFGGSFVAYAYGRSRWPEGFAAAARHTEVVIGSVNTALLLTSSLSVALAVVAARALRTVDRASTDAEARQRTSAHRHVALCLWITAALGVAFLVLKGIEYRKDWLDGLVPGAAFRLGDENGAPPAGAQLFFVLYWVMTGLHAVHMTIGVVVIAVFAGGASRDAGWVHPPRIDVAALYWHFVDVVWILLYPLLYLAGRT